LAVALQRDELVVFVAEVDDAHDFFTGLGFEVDNVRMSRPVSGPGRAQFGGC